MGIGCSVPSLPVVTNYLRSRDCTSQMGKWSPEALLGSKRRLAKHHPAPLYPDFLTFWLLLTQGAGGWEGILPEEGP